MQRRPSLYPIAAVEDRYGGVYSGGRWLAIAGADELISPGLRRIDTIFGQSGPHGGDVEAAIFWADPPEWLDVGDTPDDAVAALKAKNLKVRGDRK